MSVAIASLNETESVHSTLPACNSSSSRRRRPGHNDRMLVRNLEHRVSRQRWQARQFRPARLWRREQTSGSSSSFSLIAFRGQETWRSSCRPPQTDNLLSARNLHCHRQRWQARQCRPGRPWRRERTSGSSSSFSLVAFEGGTSVRPHLSYEAPPSSGFG